MSDEMKISYSELGDMVLVCFDSDEYKYFMSSPPECSPSELFQIFSDLKIIPVSAKSEISVSPEISRQIWDRLIRIGYERANDLESSANYKYRDDGIVAYKIRHKETKMYSQGGQSGGRWLWSKKGKTWNQLNHIQSHMTQLNHDINPDGIPEEYENAELVQMGELNAIDMKDFQEFKKNKTK